jgi:hypothetical protein
MWQIVKDIRAELVAVAALLLISHVAFAFETHVQPPQIRVPTPQLRVPNIHTPTPNVVVPGRTNNDVTCPDRGCDDARGKVPADNRNRPDKNGGAASAIAKYRLFHFAPDTSIAGIYQAILNGGDDAAFAAVIAGYEAALALASQCAIDPSLPGCASAESVDQAKQNLQNALQDFYPDMVYLMWLLVFVGDDACTSCADPEAEMAAVEAAVEECLASPSTCDATIAQLNAVLEELGVPTSIEIYSPYTGVSMQQILYSPPETSFAEDQFGVSYPPPSTSSAPLSSYAHGYCWCS